MSRRASQVSGGSAGSGGSRGSTGSVGRGRATAARGMNASSTPKSDTKSPGPELRTPTSSPIPRQTAGTPGAATPSPSSRSPGQSPQTPETQVKQPPRTKSVQFNPTPDVPRQSKQASWCSNQTHPPMKDKGPNLSAVLLADEADDDLNQDKASSMMWRPHDVLRLVAKEAEEVRLAISLSRSASAAAAASESEESRASGPELWQTPKSSPSVLRPRSPKTRQSQHALGESLRHVQRELRPMPVSDNMLLFEDDKIAENLSAEEAAAMMHRLEHGYSMAAPPKQLFHFLFPGQGAQLSTSPADDVDAGAGPSRSEKDKDKDKDKAEPGQEQEAAKAKGEGDEHGECPIICFGSDRGTNPAPITLVQVRGDAPPAWFPGYLMALPETRGILEARPSPTEVMQAAYRAAEPANVPPGCHIVY